MLKAIMFDVDDVILRWLDGFCDYMTAQGYPPATRTPSEWKFAEKMFPGVDPAFVYSQIPEFNKSRDYAFLQDHQGAIAGMITIRANTDWPMVAVSAPGLHPLTVAMRADHLRGLPIEKLHLVDLGQSKRDVFKLNEQGSILIEDNATNALDAAEFGHFAILVNRAHNENIPTDHPNLRRVDGWDGIVDAVLELAA